MIRIGTPPQTPNATDRTGPTGQPRGDLPDPRRDALRRHDQRGGGLARDAGLSRDGGLGTGHEAASGRSHAFDRRLKDALDERGDPRRDDRDAPRERVLAVAEAAPTASAPFSAFAPFSASGAAPATATAPAGPGTEETVMVLVARIEEAYRQDLSGGIGQPVSVSVPLDGLADGLSAITVRVTPAGLDVTLMRGHGDAPSDLVGAAQLLAAHLQARFAKRSVRILEGVEGVEGAGPRAGGDTLSAIGRLLGHTTR